MNNGTLFGNEISLSRIGSEFYMARYLAVFCMQDPLRQIPGPPGLPLFGNALQMDQSYLHVQLHEWAKEYGPVMKIKIFTKPIVLVNSIKAINEALLTKGKVIPLCTWNSLIAQWRECLTQHRKILGSIPHHAKQP